MSARAAWIALAVAVGVAGWWLRGRSIEVPTPHGYAAEARLPTPTTLPPEREPIELPPPPFEERRATGERPAPRLRLEELSSERRDPAEADAAWLARHGLTLHDLAEPSAPDLLAVKGDRLHVACYDTDVVFAIAR